MNFEGTLKRLQENNLNYQILEIGANRKVIIMERGGRIFGPFNGDEDGLFWMPELWNCEEKFKDFLNSDVWNCGGDRIWIAPEIQFSVGDRTRFWETLKTPSAIDPGTYTLKEEDGKAVLSQKMSLKAGQIAEGTVELSLERTVQEAKNPLDTATECRDIMEGVEYCGYTHTLMLSSDAPVEACAACWDLLQVVPEGNIYIPMYEAHNGINYYEPIGTLEKLTERGVIDRATGCNRYKVGYRASEVCGRFGYAARKDGKAYLIIRNYPNDPSNLYTEEPAGMPGVNGFSFHIYNDDGNSGGFAEIECNALSVGCPSGYKKTMDRVSTWIYFGCEEKLKKIAKKLIGFDDIEF